MRFRALLPLTKSGEWPDGLYHRIPNHPGTACHPFRGGEFGILLRSDLCRQPVSSKMFSGSGAAPRRNILGESRVNPIFFRVGGFSFFFSSFLAKSGKISVGGPFRKVVFVV